MADPKYANLPGIAHDQPDCYETNDLPEADQNREEIEEESEFIEKLHINAPHAMAKFKEKFLSSEHVDFSDRLSKARRIGYDARSGDWELAAMGEKETPMQKYERLKLEIKELLEDLTQGVERKEESPSNMLTNVESMLKQLEGLKLEQLPESETANLIDPCGAEIQKLMIDLEQVNKAADADALVSHGGEVKYTILAHPGQAVAAYSSRIASLEAKINNLMSVISTNKVIGDRSLVEMARDVESKATMLQPGHLDAAEIRVTSLLAKMDQVQERMVALSQIMTVNNDAKLDELYELTKTSDKLSNVLPKVVDRMVTLEALHNQALEFSKSRSEFESLQTALKNSCDSNQQFLRKLEESFTKDFQTIKSYADSLDARIKALNHKKGKETK